jgi:hypothetical protein
MRGRSIGKLAETSPNKGGGLPGVSGFENHIQCQLILRNGGRKFEKQAFSGHNHSDMSRQPSGQLFSCSRKYDEVTGSSNHSAIVRACAKVEIHCLTIHQHSPMPNNGEFYGDFPRDFRDSQHYYWV